MKNLIFTIITLLLFQAVLLGQDKIKKELFGESDNMIQQIKELKGNVYAPNTLAEGMESYKDAENDFKEGGNMEDIKESITEANEKYKKVIEFVDLANLSFPSTIEAREDAITAESEKYTSGLWKEAETKFKEAMTEMEDNDLSTAKSLATEAEVMYRKTELAAVEQGILVNARAQIKINEEKDVSDFAPATQLLAKKHIAKAEELLAKDRYSRKEAITNAKEADYQALHAEYIANVVRQMEEKDNGYELLILDSEKPLTTLNEIIGKIGRFDKGYNDATKNLEDYIASVDEFKVTIAEQEKQIAKLEENLSKYAGVEEKLQLKMEQEAEVKAIAKTFTKSEGQVFLDGDIVIVRLYGLNFPSGQSTIKPENYGLLKKVQNGIESFDNCTVIIQGHTDSRGSNDMNMKLSDERSGAVLEYIVSNLSFPRNRIISKGYGENKPLASNETEEGMARNRRIDVAITPEWAK